MRIFTLTLLFVLVFFSSLAFCQIYKWVNADGTICYSDSPPAGTKNVTKVDTSQGYNNISVLNNNSNDISNNNTAQHNTENVAKENNVDLYVTSWCPYCRMAIKFFKTRNINVNIYNIEKDKAAYRRKKELDNRRGIPFAVINGHKVHGFNEALYQEYLNH